MIRRWWSLVLVLILLGCTPKGCARDAAAAVVEPLANAATAAVIPPAAPPPKPTGDTLADALALAQWRLGQAEAAASAARSEIQTIREEQDRERQASYQRWLYGITIATFAAAALCVGLGLLITMLAKPMFAFAAVFASLGVLTLTAAALVPYLLWVALGAGVLVAGVVIWALRRSDGTLQKVTRVVDEVTEKAPVELVGGLLSRFREVMDDADKKLVRKHRARRVAATAASGPGNPKG